MNRFREKLKTVDFEFRKVTYFPRFGYHKDYS